LKFEKILFFVEKNAVKKKILGWHAWATIVKYVFNILKVFF